MALERVPLYLVRGLGAVGLTTARGRAFTSPFPWSGAAPVGGWTVGSSRNTIKHPAVTSIQVKLNERGFRDYPGNVLAVEAAGWWGIKTHSAYIDAMAEVAALMQYHLPPMDPHAAYTRLVEFQNLRTTPTFSSAFNIKSYLPTETPPEVIRASCVRPSLIFRLKISSSSGAIPRSTGMQKACFTSPSNE